MAVATRQVRVKAANRGGTIAAGAISGGTTITGFCGIEWSHQADVARGNSDGEIGATTIDIRGWSTRGQITLDDHSLALALADIANQSLAFTFYEQGGTVKAGRFASVSYGGITEIEYPSGDSSGKTTRYSLGFEAIYGATDAKPADVLTFA